MMEAVTMAGVRVDPATAAQNWATAMGNAGPKYTAGVQKVTVAPGQVAANNADKWANNVAQSKGKYAANSAAVTLQQWQSDTVNKGASRLGTGATNAQQKMQVFMGKLTTNINNAVAGLQPRGDFNTNINRLTTYLTAMHQTKGTY